MNEERHVLPEGWLRKSLGEMVELNYGKGLPAKIRSLSGETPVYGSNGVVGRHDKALTGSPVIVIGRKGSVGEIHLASVPCWPIDTTYFVDEFPSGLDATFLFRYLKSQRVGDLDRSTAVPGINREDVYRLSVPLPPLAEQQRIVAKIEALFDQSRTARQALDRIPPLLKKFRQAVLAAAFRGDLTCDWREQHTDAESASVMLERIRAERRHESEGPYRGSNHAERKTVDMGDLPGLPPSWVWCTLDQCTNLITKGESPNWQGYQYVAEGVPFVRSENVLWGALDLSGVARVPDTFHQKLQRSKLKPNDVLINLVGASIGRCAIVPSELCEANINQAVATIRTAGTLYPPYLLHLLLSPAMQEVIQGKRVEVARPNISLGDLRNLIIPLAPAAEQERIVFKIDQLFAVVAAIEMAVQVAEQRADLLDRSILTRAFSGELVPQDPNDEPVSVLLKRIGTERGMASASKRLRPDGVGKRKHHASKRMARG